MRGATIRITILKFTLKQLRHVSVLQLHQTVQHTDTNKNLIYTATEPPY